MQRFALLCEQSHLRWERKQGCITPLVRGRGRANLVWEPVLLLARKQGEAPRHRMPALTSASRELFYRRGEKDGSPVLPAAAPSEHGSCAKARPWLRRFQAPLRRLQRQVLGAAAWGAAPVRSRERREGWGRRGGRDNGRKQLERGERPLSLIHI